MKIYLMGEWAFVDLVKEGYMLCIGRKDDVDGASQAEIGHMVLEAIATSQFRSIEDTKQQTLH